MTSRADAKAAGLKRYFTGKPCKHGHVSERLLSDRNCLACANIKRAAVLKNHYRSDTEHRQKKIAYTAKRRKENPEYNVQKSASFKKRYLESEEVRTKHKANGDKQYAVKLARRNAKDAAETLTTLLGVPHVVIETVDASGNKTFQPVQESGLPGKTDG